MRAQGRMAAVAVALGVVLSSACVPAGAQRVGDLHIEDPWVRATPPGAGVTGGFMTVRNTGVQDDRLLTVTSAAVARVEIHEMRHEDGMMRMRRIDAGLPVKAGAKIELAPGGYHLMLFGPKQRFVEGDVVVATARFERAGNVEIAFRVRGLGAKREAAHHGH